MTDTQRIDWIERVGANVVGVTTETLIPERFGVVVNRVTGWHWANTLRDAIDACEIDTRTTHPALSK